MLRQLRDGYLLDVRIWKQGARGRPGSTYFLAGRWENGRYRDFVAEAIAR